MGDITGLSSDEKALVTKARFDKMCEFLTDGQREYVLTIPARHRFQYVEAHTGKSRATAMKAMCKECCGYENVIEQIRGCGVEKCPLYSYREYK